MRASLLQLSSLRTSLLGAMGISGLLGCGGQVVFDNGTGGTGTSGTTNGSTHAATNASAGTGSSPCAGAQPVILQGKDSGYVRCADGAVDRASANACDPTVNLTACQGTEENLQCKVDSDCTGHPYGHCVHVDNIDLGGSSCGCVFSCGSDAECDDGTSCACAGVAIGIGFSQCIADNCHIDSDCQSGECGISSYNNGCSQVVQLACRSAQDKCHSTASCTNSGCGPDTIGSPYTCQSPHCAVGRPLMVDGAARVAPNAGRADWQLASRVDVDLDLESRAIVARHYADVAALEHASIGSFARFTLQLLFVGAPAELVMDAQRASMDEIEHARLCYGLASDYAAEPIGPAPFPEAIAQIESDVPAIVRALILEGCVGETIGALEASVVASGAKPSIALIHRRIAIDEERHAALAWRTLRWLLGQDETLSNVAREAFDFAASQYARDPEGLLTGISEHGVLSSRELGDLRRQCLSEVIGPCARALFEGDSAIAISFDQGSATEPVCASAPQPCSVVIGSDGV